MGRGRSHQASLKGNVTGETRGNGAEVREILSVDVETEIVRETETARGIVIESGSGTVTGIASGIEIIIIGIGSATEKKHEINAGRRKVFGAKPSALLVSAVQLPVY